LASATFLLAGASFWKIWQNYKFRTEEAMNQAKTRIRDWAEKSINLLTIPSPVKYDEAITTLKASIQQVRVGSLSSLADAEKVGLDIKTKVQKAVLDFNVLIDKTEKADKSINFEELFKSLLLDFTDIINFT
jgi:hypothetical protein